MEKIKLMIIEDSVTMRNFLFQAFASDQEIEIISYASNGKLAIPRIKFYQPDIIILDYEMPLMNGIETIREIKKLNVPSKIIMFSAHTQEGATVTLQALKEGAVDFVPKPNLSISNQNQLVDYIKNELIPKVKEIAYGNKIIQKRQEIPPIEKKIVEKTAIHQIQVAGIGISTGGPILLYEMFRKLSRIKKFIYCSTYASLVHSKTSRNPQRNFCESSCRSKRWRRSKRRICLCGSWWISFKSSFH